MSTMTTNPYLQYNRLRKALVLATTLHQYNVGVELARQAPRTFWVELSALLGVREPSDETIEVAIQKLGEMTHPPSGFDLIQERLKG